MVIYRDFLRGPWRAVLVLGVTQIIAWGALFYPVVLLTKTPIPFLALATVGLWQ